jgi:hypothetical protein
VDPTRIAIGGASAGGGLAAALGLLARDRGEVPLAFQLLIYPMLDDRTVTAAEPHPFTGEFVWTPQANYFGWRALLGQEPGSPDVSPYAAAARAESLEGLPPTFISVGTLDLFLEEDLEYARRLIRAGVPTELHVYPGAFHGFDMAESAKVTQTSVRDRLDALVRVYHIQNLNTQDARPLAFSSSGHLLVTCTQDNKVEVWDAMTGQLLQSFFYLYSSHELLTYQLLAVCRRILAFLAIAFLICLNHQIADFLRII